MFYRNTVLLGVSVFALAHATVVLAVPSLSTGATAQLGTGPVLTATPSTGPGYSFSSAIQVLGPIASTGSASSDTNYNTRARSSVQGTGISGSSAQWFETITNTTAGDRRYSFTFQIDGGSLLVSSSGGLQNGSATAGFEALFDLSRSGVASNLFAVSRQVGSTTTAGSAVFSNATRNNYAAVTSGSLLESAISTGGSTTSQSWSNSVFTIDLGVLASNESFTLAYLLRSFTNSSVLDSGACLLTPGYGYGYGYGQSTCLTSSTRSGDPGQFLSTGDPRIGLSSIAVTTSVPEPASLAILGIGLAGMGAARRRAKAA